ncbi:hypothetical protein GYMLUDRAFT_249440 [Collybiopsis luxurians FD-317 M1]|uniref:Uncharacterized protein n=1 Tax=Collybiopsis luxurians FD-317 M1 TaxID=944289 RepID=A0A0D0C987_9AGAR|nr:hypothetical protein GYMLUDRAFT_249440 [Collybiopsis luxurians FD-317 M1]
MTSTITSSSPIPSKQPISDRRTRSSMGTFTLKNAKESKRVNDSRRRHMNNEERKKILEDDPLIEPGSVRPRSVTCRICKVIVKLNGRRNYHAHNWKKHMCTTKVLKDNLDAFKTVWEERTTMRRREEAALALLCLREKDVAINVQ